MPKFRFEIFNGPSEVYMGGVYDVCGGVWCVRCYGGICGVSISVPTHNSWFSCPNQDLKCCEYESDPIVANVP